MEKKDLKWYVSPEMETYEAEVESTLLNASASQGGNQWIDAPGVEDED